MQVKIEGLEDVRAILSDVSSREAKNLLRATVHGVAGTIRDDAKSEMPQDSGVLRKSTKAQRRRGQRGEVRSDVVVGKKAFYWRFLEYGSGPDHVEHAFFGKAVEKFRAQMVEIFTAQFGKKWEAALKRAARRRGG